MNIEKNKRKPKLPNSIREKVRDGKVIGYEYRTQKDGRKISLFAKDVRSLQDKITDMNVDERLGIKKSKSKITLNELYIEKMESLEGILKPNTIANYRDMYEKYVKDHLGSRKVTSIERNDIQKLYKDLLTGKYGIKLKKNSISNVQTVIHPILEEAVDRNIITHNPSDNAMKKLKYVRPKGHKKGLTIEQTQILFKFLKNSKEFKRWYSLLLFMFETGTRVGELSALQTYDITDGKVQIDKTLVDYPKEVDGKNITMYEIHSAKTAAGLRRIPLSKNALKALKLEKKQNENLMRDDQLPVSFTDDDYDSDVDDMITTKYKRKKDFVAKDFLFINRFQKAYKSSTINRALKRIREECNKQAGYEALPNFSCHSARHTFASRLNDAEISEKAKHALLGHSDPDITNRIYVDISDMTLYNAINKYNEFVEKNKIYD